jgi:predicted secreted protein
VDEFAQPDPLAGSGNFARGGVHGIGHSEDSQAGGLAARIDTNLDTGLRWDLKPLAGKVAVAVPLADVAPRPGVPVPSAPLETAFHFRGITPGTQPVELEYRRPFETSAPGAKTVRFDIVVR